MAISNLLPRKKMRSRSRFKSIKERMKYDQKEEKTEDGRLVSAYMCCPESAAEEFEMAKLLYERTTGRKQPEERDIIAYRIIQSFKPGEITPEDANKLGYKLAMEFTKGRHQFVVSTHVDKAHIHTHIEFNSVNLECDGKFNNFKDSSFALRRLNDQICREHGYSVIEKPKARGQSYKEKAAVKYGRSHKERLRQTIDRILPLSRDFDDFLARMQDEGYEIKRRGQSLEFRNPQQEKFTRSYRLGEEYTEEALRRRAGKDAVKKEAEKRTDRTSGRKVNLLVDIRAKMETGKGKGFERWAQVFNLKEAARTINFLSEKGISDYGELETKAEQAGEKFDALSERMKQLEGRMKEKAELKRHIINYARTKDIYTAYQKSRCRSDYRDAHADAIEMHEAAKAAFDALGKRPIPKAAQLSGEYAVLLAEKKACYEEYKAARKEMIDYRNAKQNVDQILGLRAEQEKQKETER